MNMKDILGPIRTNKKERKAATNRFQNRIKIKNLAMEKFGPEKSLLHQYRMGQVSKSRLNAIPLKKYEPMVKDDINPFKKNTQFMKTKKFRFDSEFFK